MTRLARFAVIAIVASALFAPAVAAQDENRLVVLETTLGNIVVELFADRAPETVNQIEGLVEAGAYDGTPWVRVVPGFIVQTGQVEVHRNPPLDEAQLELVRPLPLEATAADRHVRGVLSMARFDDPGSGTSSFSILVGAAPHLDGEYTIFGEVSDGMSVVDALAAVATGDNDVPTTPVAIERARLVTAEEADDLVTSPESTNDTGVELALLGAFGFAVAAFVATGRLAPRYIAALALLAALCAGFGLFLTLVPASSGAVAVLIFMGVFAMLRLLSRFEALDRD